MYSKTCLKRPLKKNTKNFFQYRLSLNAGQKYCRMLQGEHSAILSTSIKLPFSIKTLVLSIFKWPLKTGFTVFSMDCPRQCKSRFDNIVLQYRGGPNISLLGSMQVLMQK